MVLRYFTGKLKFMSFWDGPVVFLAFSIDLIARLYSAVQLS